MATKGDGVWTMNSLVLKFLFLPFRWLTIICMVILIVFGTSILTQGYLNTDEALNEEMAQVSQFARNDTKINDSSVPVTLKVSGMTYRTMDKVFFGWTGVHKAMAARSESDSGYSLKQKILLPNLVILKQVDTSLRMVSIRIGYIIWFVYFAMIVSFVALVDGLVARAVRQKNAGRESAGLYHRAKYWRSGILWLSISFYLAWPVSISPFWLFIPCLGYAFLIWMQAKYLKKYL